MLTLGRNSKTIYFVRNTSIGFIYKTLLPIVKYPEIKTNQVLNYTTKQTNFFQNCLGNFKGSNYRTDIIPVITRNIKVDGVTTKLDTLLYSNSIFYNPQEGYKKVGYLTLNESENVIIFVFDYDYIKDYFKPLLRFDFNNVCGNRCQVIFQEHLKIEIIHKHIELDIDKFNKFISDDT